MFCHERYSLLVVFEKKQHNRLNTREDTMGEPRGRREQVIACTLIARGACCGRGKDGIHLPMGWPIGEHQRCIRRSSLPDTSRPARFSISASHHPAACVLPLRRLALAKPERPSSRNHALRHSRRRTAERSCLMRDMREMKASMGTSASLFEQETGWS